MRRIMQRNQFQNPAEYLPLQSLQSRFGSFNQANARRIFPQHSIAVMPQTRFTPLAAQTFQIGEPL